MAGWIEAGPILLRLDIAEKIAGELTDLQQEPQVAALRGDSRAGMGALPGLKEVERDSAGLGILAENARRDEKDVAHVQPLNVCSGEDGD